jgi:adenine-specific DNA-methyltransferase
MISAAKSLGQFYTPPFVARTLTGWVIRHQSDTLLDPSCGNGEFLICHEKSVGVEICDQTRMVARSRAPLSRIFPDDFFGWASRTNLRFEAVAGNPPFIRYQRFNGVQRKAALTLAESKGAKFSGLTSSWAPFLVISASLLKKGGRLGFVVPAEVGHATYAPPLIQYLTENFEFVHFIAVREKLFPKLSEDAWLLYCNGYGGATNKIAWSTVTEFSSALNPDNPTRYIPVTEWKRHGKRLRKFLLPDGTLELYERLSKKESVKRLGDIAQTGIGYVTGDNAFFHLTPSEVANYGIPKDFLRISIRNGEQLKSGFVDEESISKWLSENREVFLLDLAGRTDIPAQIKSYLESPAGQSASRAYKCRTRKPWFAVPDVAAPDAFVTYMNGLNPAFVANNANCVCTNSLLAIRFKNGTKVEKVAEAWKRPLSRLSQELEGHPLGGGMLKLEPREAAGVVLPMEDIDRIDEQAILDAVDYIRAWRHAKPNEDGTVS